MKISFLRHATFILEAGGKRFLVDPMLSSKDAMDTVANAANSLRNPLIDLPFDEAKLKENLKNLDAVLVTHTHRDHWDAKAVELLDKGLLIIAQPADEAKIKGQGFTNVRTIETSLQLGEITIYRTGGQHGSGETGKRMGTVSGFVVDVNGQKVYIAGDTIWCPEVELALTTYDPQFVVVNAGAAQFKEGGPITMTAEDVIAVARKQSRSKIIAVHMESINHCLLKRADLRAALEKEKITKQVLIPADGEEVRLA